jgi:hypothetical protein
MRPPGIQYETELSIQRNARERARESVCVREGYYDHGIDLLESIRNFSDEGAGLRISHEKSLQQHAYNLHF